MSDHTTMHVDISSEASQLPLPAELPALVRNYVDGEDYNDIGPDYLQVAGTASTGSAERLARDLIELKRGDATTGRAPATFDFQVYEEPYYEYLGTYFAQAGDRELFSGECDAGGNVVLGWDAVAKIIAGTPGDRDTLITALKIAFDER